VVRSSSSSARHRRYAIAGLGSRGYHMFAEPLAREFENVELVGFFDRNHRRMQLAKERLGLEIPCFDDIDELLSSTQPDVVIVCTPDWTHAQYVIAALEAGCDVIVEKPLATTVANIKAILEAEERCSGTVRVSHNARFGAAEEAVYRLLRQGAIGSLVTVEFLELLNTSHGADYFRRWHRQKAYSGGLLVHKACHHFDLLNWWIASEPLWVIAEGGRRFYGENGPWRGERCLGCAHADACPFYLDLRGKPELANLYLSAEEQDGYIRDRCVFARDIDIEDHVSMLIRYENGVQVSYSLLAFSPWEGQRVAFNGTKGRLDIDLVDRIHVRDLSGQLVVKHVDIPPVVRQSPLFEEPRQISYERRTGDHGGADRRIRDVLFGGCSDPLERKLTAREGALAALIGIAANRSLEIGEKVYVRELLGS